MPCNTCVVLAELLQQLPTPAAAEICRDESAATLTSWGNCLQPWINLQHFYTVSNYMLQFSPHAPSNSLASSSAEVFVFLSEIAVEGGKVQVAPDVIQKLCSCGEKPLQRTHGPSMDKVCPRSEAHSWFANLNCTVLTCVPCSYASFDCR